MGLEPISLSELKRCEPLKAMFCVRRTALLAGDEKFTYAKARQDAAVTAAASGGGQRKIDQNERKKQTKETKKETKKPKKEVEPKNKADAKNETKKPKKGAPAETSNRVAAAGPKKVASKVHVPAVNDRVEVDFTDRAYVGTVLDVRTATKKHKKGGASKKTELEFEVHFDEDDERMWVSLSHLWRWVS